MPQDAGGRGRIESRPVTQLLEGKAMKKRRATKPTDVTKLPARHRAAIAMLSKWAKEKSPVEFIDSLSGLRFPGHLVDSSSENLLTFDFVGAGGILAGTLPFLWKKITVDSRGWGCVNIEEDTGRRFTIRKDLSRQSPDEEIKLVMEKLSHWQNAKTNVYVSVSLRSTCGFLFLGTIDQVMDGAAIIKPDGSDGRVMLALPGCICRRSNNDKEVSIIDVTSQLRVSISEKLFTPQQLLEHLPLETSFVQ
jgi:hypothetical protein